VSDTSAALCLPEQIEFQGTTYKVGPVSFEIEAIFCDGLLDRALSLAVRKAHVLGPAGARDLLAGVARDQAAYQYEWGSDTVTKAIYSAGGFRRLFFLAVKKNHRDFTEAQSEAICDDQQKWEEAQKVMGKLLKGPDPTTPPEAADNV